MQIFKYIIIISALSLFMFSCKETNKQETIEVSQKQKVELDTLSNFKILKNPFNYDTETYSSMYDNGQKISESDFFAKMKQNDKSIDSIKLHNEEKKATLYFSSKECLDCKGKFFHVTNEYYMNDYYRLQDIYSSVFNNTSVNTISLFVDGKFHTYFPSGGGYTFLCPNNGLDRDWFIENVDYYKIFSPNEMDNFIYENEELQMLDETFITNRIRSFQKNKSNE